MEGRRSRRCAVGFNIPPEMWNGTRVERAERGWTGARQHRTRALKRE